MNINETLLDKPKRGSECSVYSPNQILNSEQLNKVTSYLAYQEHLTRVKLLGVGIIDGLRGALANDGQITIRRGFGVTTDGDVLILPEDTVYTQFRPYDQSAPHYAPFYEGQKMRTIYELRTDAQKDGNPQPLAQFPDQLATMTVVMLMESFQEDQNSCTGTSCDSLGKTLIETPRMLLVDSETAAAISSSSAGSTFNQIALQMPLIAAVRTIVTPKMNTLKSLADAYRKACRETLTQWKTLLENLDQQVLSLLTLDETLEPPMKWVDKLFVLLGTVGDIGIQYLSDFFKDIADTWNELRERLFQDEHVRGPEVNGFPKHLVLGDLVDFEVNRTGCFPSPLIVGQRREQNHVRFLVRKLNRLVNGFQLKIASDLGINISPSATERTSLENRAVPFYLHQDTFAVWSFRLSQRDAENKAQHGYWLENTFSSDKVVPSESMPQIGRADFFRIEGHLSQDVKDVEPKIESLISRYNLPFTLRKVLLHHERKNIIGLPKNRFGDLNRLHQLIRKDLSIQLVDTGEFQDRMKKDLTAEIAGTADSEVPIKVNAQVFQELDSVKSKLSVAKQPLAESTYSGYLDKIQSMDFTQAYSSVVESARNVKAGAGDVVRTDVTTPFDTLQISNHPAWLDWLDRLIESKNNQADDKLLFATFVQEHPQLEHLAGVPSGGTFILVYDEGGKVVADFMLPYYWPDTTETEPKEPVVLKDPPSKVPVSFTGIKFLPAISSRFELVKKLTDTQIENFKTDPPEVWKSIAKQVVQSDYTDLFKRSTDVFTNLFGVKTQSIPLRAAAGRTFVNDKLRVSMEAIIAKREFVDQKRAELVDPEMDPESRPKALTALIKAESDLVSAILEGPTAIIKNKIDLTLAGDGHNANQVIAEALNSVQNLESIQALKERYRTVSRGNVQLINLADAFGI